VLSLGQRAPDASLFHLVGSFLNLRTPHQFDRATCRSIVQSGMARSKPTHADRENPVLADLEAHFPHFAGQALSWTPVLGGQDPPDFISNSPNGLVGLELIEWLNGTQMGSAKTRESHQGRIHRILTHEWEKEYQPQNFRGAFPSLLGNGRISRIDELLFRQQFYECVTDVDRTWAVDMDHLGNSYTETEFSKYPVLAKNVARIHFVGGEPHSSCWIGEHGCGGAFDPNAPVDTLKEALDKKLTDYSIEVKPVHFQAHGLTELDLLVHGGSNVFQYNTPPGHKFSLERIARLGADYYAVHPLRQIFSRVWFFHSLDSADEINLLMGFAPNAGRVRLLAQLWPRFIVYAGSETNEMYKSFKHSE
jgi:hypothetical protein